MNQTKWFATGNLAWRRIDEDALPADFLYSGRYIDGIPQDATFELVQELYEVEIQDDDCALTGNFKWVPLPIMPQDPPKPEPIGGFLPVFATNANDQ